MSDSAAAPTSAQDFAIDAIRSGWSVLLKHGKDTAGSPFVSVEAVKDERHLRITWHTRSTGTYRLFACSLNLGDVSLRGARAELAR